MKKLVFGILLGILVLLASCVSVTFEGLQMQKDMPNFQVIKEFKKVINDPHLLGAGSGFGLIPLGQPDKEIFEAIRSEINKVSGDGAIDVTIKYGQSFGNMIINTMTVYLYSPRKITITGTIVKFTD